MPDEVTYVWRGVVTSGQGHCSIGAGFPSEYVPGSLNLLPAPGELPLLGRVDDHREGWWTGTRWMPVIVCNVEARSPVGYRHHRAAVAHVGLGNSDIAELVSHTHLRTWFDVTDGDVVELYIPGGIRP